MTPQVKFHLERIRVPTKPPTADGERVSLETYPKVHLVANESDFSGSRFSETCLKIEHLPEIMKIVGN